MVYWLRVDNRRVKYRVISVYYILYGRNRYFSLPTYSGSKQLLVFNFRCSVDSKNLDQQKGGRKIDVKVGTSKFSYYYRVVMETLGVNKPPFI